MNKQQLQEHADRLAEYIALFLDGEIDRQELEGAMLNYYNEKEGI